MTYSGTMLVEPGLFFSKVAILVLFLRIFSPHRSMRLSISAVIALAFCTYFVNVPVNTYYCTPRPGQSWGIEIGNNCANSILLGPIQGVLNVVIDFYILIAPIPMVAKLHLPPRRKYGVMAVFMTVIL